LEQDQLSTPEILYGVRAVFVLRHRDQMQTRRPGRPLKEIDHFANSMCDQVFEEAIFIPENANSESIQHAIHVLSERLQCDLDVDYAVMLAELLNRMEEERLN
ncbi:MAG: hypothetical protein GYB68_15095, partial [Chloroflexi bacterium]|nr:hypothetical protein [Chloroflexota bacterium]